MQEYNRIEDTEYISDAPSQLNKNMESIATDFSGASFPTDNLFVGMKCLRTDENKIYRLYENASNQLVWQLEYTIVDGGIKVKQAEQAEQAEQATNDANGKDISTYVAKLESDVNNAFVINVYDGDNNKLGSVTIPETKVEIMTGASSSSAGKAGLVPQPKAGDNDKFLCGDGSFKEAGKVKSVNGKTGDVVVDVLPIGAIIPHSGNTVPTGYLTCNGAAVSRTTYADLFAVIGTTYGKGDGSTTFNLPNLNNNSFLEGSNTVGTVKSAGLPNITGNTTAYDDTNTNISKALRGAFYPEYRTNELGIAGQGWYTRNCYKESFDASRSNSIYGNSDTVQPKSVTVKYIIKAFSSITNEGDIDVKNLASDYERVNTEITNTKNSISGISDYIIESYRNGTEWYDIYKSGKVRQGGTLKSISADNTTTKTFLKAFKDTDYTIGIQGIGAYTRAGEANNVVNAKTSTSFSMVSGYNGIKDFSWVAEGQGA